MFTNTDESFGLRSAKELDAGVGRVVSIGTEQLVDRGTKSCQIHSQLLHSFPAAPHVTSHEASRIMSGTVWNVDQTDGQ